MDTEKFIAIGHRMSGHFQMLFRDLMSEFFGTVLILIFIWGCMRFFLIHYEDHVLNKEEKPKKDTQLYCENMNSKGGTEL